VDTNNSNSQPKNKHLGGATWIVLGLAVLVVALLGFVFYQQRVNANLARDAASTNARPEMNNQAAVANPAAFTTPQAGAAVGQAQTLAPTPLAPPANLGQAEDNPVAATPRTATGVRAYTNKRAAKEAYRSGKISKSEYKSITQRLQETKAQKLARAKADYNSGKMSKSEYKDKATAIRSQYE
jgi:hypothetical protein